MANMSLEELRNQSQAVLDTTKGKVTTPMTSTPKPTLAESDPAFTRSNQSVPGTRRTPVINGNPPPTPSIKVVHASFDSENAVPFDLNTLEKRPPEENPYEQELMSDLDKAVEAEKKSISQRIAAITEKQYEEFIEGKVGSEGSSVRVDVTVPDESPEPEVKYNIPEPIKEEVTIHSTNTVEIDNDIDGDIYKDEGDTSDDEDLGDYAEKEMDSFTFNETPINADDIEKDLNAEVGNIEDDERESIFKNFQKDVRSITNPIKNKINLKNFKIAKESISPAKIHMTISDISTADHFLPNANRVITCSALSGPEMLRMNPENSNRSRINTLREIYNIIYRHVESKKPSSVDEWLKNMRFSDIDHIYFALYKATFGGSNFIHYECPNNSCGNVFIKDISFDDLIKYDNDEIKDKMKELFMSGNDSIPENNVELYQITDELVVGLRNPSIWNVVIETASLSDNFLEKYEELIDVISYIDSIYTIDMQTSSLIPIDLKPDKNDVAKSSARRIKILADVLRKLPSDNYYQLRADIANAFPNISSVSYKIPECTCPKCNTSIGETAIGAQQLLFMRHQLGAFGAL